MSGNTPMRLVLLAALAVMAATYALPAAAQNETDVMTPPSGSWTDLAGQNVVLIESTGFVPDPVTILAGDTVTWVNNDTSPHTVTGATPDGRQVFNSGVIAPGDTFTYPFTEPGTYAYASTTTGMTGAVIVGGTGTGQPAGDVAEGNATGTAPGAGGNETPSESAAPGMTGNESPIGVISSNESVNATQGTAPGEGGAPEMGGNASPLNLTENEAPSSGGGGAPETETEGSLPSTTPTPTPTPLYATGAIWALAVAGLWAAAKKRR